MQNVTVLKELLDMITHNNVFEIDEEYYIQTRGYPMGNIMAPFSGIFMRELEQRLIELDAGVRYIDNICMVWQGPKTDF